MKYPICSKWFLLSIVVLAVFSCGKEELTFNPEASQATTFEELQEIQSFFDRKETTFIITEEEYDQLIVSRVDSTFTFQEDEIFANFDQYTHISYPYFSDSPGLFFMGEITNLNANGSSVSFDITRCTYEDLFDDYLINTFLPNGYPSTRSDCGKSQIDLAQANSEVQSALNGLLNSLSSSFTKALKEELANTYLQDGSFSIQNVGTMTGCVGFIKSKNFSGFEISNFSLDGYGVQLSFGNPKIDFDKLKTNLQTTPKPILKEFEDELKNMVNPFQGLFTTGNKSLSKASFVSPGMKSNFLGGIDFEAGGDFLFNSLGLISTTEPITLQVKQLEGDIAPTTFINGNSSQSINDFLFFSGDLYMGAQASLGAELLAGISISDLGGAIELGFLVGYEATIGLEGQVGNLTESNGTSENYLEGCASYTEKLNTYAFGESSIVNAFLSVPNVALIKSSTVYDMSQDPNIHQQVSGIEYNKVCRPDNCVAIDDSKSFVKLINNQNGMYEFDYYVESTEVGPQGFKVEIKQGSIKETIVENGVYGALNTVTVPISSSIATSLNSDILSNISVIITDKFNECMKNINLLKLNVSCNNDFENVVSGLFLRRYNIDISVSQDSENCQSTLDPIWVYSEQSLIDLYGFAEGYESIDYMSMENCLCYAEKLSNDAVTYFVPAIFSMELFIEENIGKDFSMLQGGNQYCSNFTPSGYIIKNWFECSTAFTITSQEALTTQRCIKDFGNAYFFVENLDFDPLNDYLFEVKSNGDMSIQPAPKGILAPCRLQKVLN